MTREAKIGMLTGLGVIVLIGVLLSEYLGGGVHPGGLGGMSPTGRMAELPLGAAYRQEITQPVGVPGLAPSSSAVAPSAGMARSGLSAGTPNMPAPGFATATPATPSMTSSVSVPSMNGPTVNQPVAPVPSANVQLDTPVTRSLPTMQLPSNQGVQQVYVAGETAPAGNAAPDPTDSPAARPARAVTGKEYVIASGDNLAKIARKFYNSSKKSDLQRIVAANPGILKNEQSVLYVGKKLIIPTVATSPRAEESIPGPLAKTTAANRLSMVIHQPGVGRAKAAAESTPAEKSAKASPEKVYVVKSGDTLEKIAKRLSPGNVSEMVKKLMVANGIKDAKSLQVGAKLKIPSQAA